MPWQIKLSLKINSARCKALAGVFRLEMVKANAFQFCKFNYFEKATIVDLPAQPERGPVWISILARF